MEVNKLVFGGLALGCLVAAAAGGYLAARPSAPSSETALAAPLTPAASETLSAPAPVTESEGVITPAPAPDPDPAPSAERAPAPRRPATPPTRTEAPSRRTTSNNTARSTRAATPPPSRSTPAARNDTPAPAPSAPAAPAVGGMWEPRPSVTPERVPVFEAEPEAPPARPAPEFLELVIPSDSVLGLQIERTISSEHARIEDRVDARVTRDVRVGDRVAIPAGSTVQGSVIEVERGGKVKERARLGIRFHTVVLADGTRLNIRTDPVVREGASPARESAAKIGGAAVGGAILGAILGGGKGAIIGGATGAAGGTAATMASDRNPAVLSAGSTVSVRVQQPVTVTVEK